MKVLVIGYMHQKDDKRVFRTVKALSTKAEVIYQYFSKDETEPYKDGNILYYPLKKEPRKGILKKMMSRYEFDSNIVKLIEKEEYDILYLHAFPFTKPLSGFKIAKERGKKIIYDLHELHPEDVFENLPIILKDFKRRWLWNILAKQLQFTDRLVVVSQEQFNEILKHISHRVTSKYLVVPNYASNSKYNSTKNKEICIVGKTQRKFSTSDQELLQKLKSVGFKIKVIGMENISADGIVDVKVDLLPYEEMLNEISKSLFSFISFYTGTKVPTKNDIFSLTHKFFDSIAASTPVIVNEHFVSMKAIAERYGVGVCINPEKTDDAFFKIMSAYNRYEDLLMNIKKNQHEFVWTEEKENNFVSFVLD